MDYILFIVLGVFYVVKLLDLLFEFQGCLFICVELCVLIEVDFVRILIEIDNVLICQYMVLMGIEEVVVEFIDDGIFVFVVIVVEVNRLVENIGV